MNTFVRQLAVLSVLWSLCELLLPDGRQQKMVRMTVSVLVMVALLSAVSRMLQSDLHMEGVPALAPAAQQATEESYLRTALQAAANQTESLCVRLANRAGYAASAAVYLRPSGEVERITLRLTGWLDEATPPLLGKEALAQAIAEQTGAKPQAIQIAQDGAEEP